jgi:hypothetical protein
VENRVLLEWGDPDERATLVDNAAAKLHASSIVSRSIGPESPTSKASATIRELAYANAARRFSMSNS